jgi:CelD/BcsL family acetyltransferase involved in cellulose biosynthesis
MEIRIHTDILHPELYEWDELLSQSATDVPFLKRGFLANWCSCWGGGEWPADTEVMVFSGWENGKLAGLAPMFLTKSEKEGHILRFLGAEEISDYLDFIVQPADIHLFLHAWLTSLDSENSEPIRTVSLVNIPLDSPSLPALQTIASELGWSIQTEKAYHTPVIPLAATWDDYLAGIDKKQRHEIRRKLRRVEENAESAAWRIVDEAHTLNYEFESLFALMETEIEKQKFLTPAMREQMRRIFKWAFDEGFLQLSFLEINGDKAAAYCCFDYNLRIYVYNSGFNMEYSEYSPGWVLLSYLIQHAIQEGKTHFDFMRGDETYKYRFGGVDGFVTRVNLSRISD